MQGEDGVVREVPFLSVRCGSQRDHGLADPHDATAPRALRRNIAGMRGIFAHQRHRVDLQAICATYEAPLGDAALLEATG